MPQFYKMSRRDSALGEQCGSVVDFCKGTNTKFANLYKNPQSSHSPTAKQGIPLGDSRCFFRNLRILEEEKQAQNLHKQPNNSRIFTQEVQNVAKSQAEVDSGSEAQNLHKQPKDSRICDEKTRRSRSFFSKSGLSSDWQGSYLDGNDRRQSRRIADLSRKAESTKKAESLHIINWEYIAKGLFIFSIGLFKKVVIADSFAKWANAGFGAVENGAVLNCLESWATSLSYTFELYFDFSGYCDMAIGLGLLFGIVLPINFSSPYKALNIATFWRKWHITLGRFLKEYLYIPLGGNQNLAYRQSRFYVALNNLLTLRNLFIVAFLSGVWHGAGWGFVIWGSLHGVAMVVHRIYMLLYKKLDSKSGDSVLGSHSADFRDLETTADLKSSSAPKSPKNYESPTAIPRIREKESQAECEKSAQILESQINSPKIAQNKGWYLRFMQTRIYILLCWILTFNFINIAWVFFRAENIQGAVNLLKGMFFGEVVLPKSLESKLGALSEWGVEFGVMWIANVVKFESSIFMVIFLVAGFVITLFLRNSCEIVSNLRLRVYNATFCAILLSISLCYIGGNDYSAFLYFNF